MGRERTSGRNHLGQGPWDVWEQPSSKSSLQGEEGVLCPLGLLVRGRGGTGRVSRVSPGGRRSRVCSLGSLLQELVKLCRNKEARAHQLWMKTRNNYTHGSCWNGHTFTGHPFLCGITFLTETDLKKESYIHVYWDNNPQWGVERTVRLQNPNKVAFHASFHHNTQAKETSGAHIHIIHMHLTTVSTSLACESLTCQSLVEIYWITVKERL